MKIKALITDVSYVLLKPKDASYTGSLNALYKEHKDKVNFNFFDFFELNNELLEYYKSLDIDLFILTSDEIQDAPALTSYWESAIKDIFSASKMNTHKTKPEAYKMVLDKINLEPEEAIYIDDNQDNIDASNSVGLNSIQYIDNEQIKRDVSKFQ